MRSRHLLLLPAACLLLALLPGWTAPAHAASGRLVDDYRSVYGTPGVAAAVIDGSSIETITRGRDGDGNPVTPRTRFRIASMSKSMTAAAIMLLADRDRVSLDDPVVRHLPAFTMADPRFTRITVRQLLSHTSGLSISTNDEYVFPPPRTAREVVAGLAGKTLAADPGTRPEYHNTNYSIAARIVEVVSGRDFDAFLRAELFEPLGMTGTGSTLGCSDRAEGLSSGYEVVLGLAVATAEMPGSCVGNGGVISTLDDMVRWLRFNQGTLGTSLLSARSLAEMHTVQPRAAGYALGWQARPASAGSPAPVIGHGGTLATWTGDMAFAPATGVGALVLTNSGGAPGLLAANLLAERAGAPATPMDNPLTVVNAVLLGLTVVMAALLVTAAVRARRWATRRRAARRPRLVLRLAPLALVTVSGVLLPALIGIQSGAFSFQYWIVVAWLMPLLALFSLTCCALGAVALARRLWCLRRAATASG
ncbi:CubicO group peptidase (beta-lactamase class C family) [Nonomuraea thailandensis]|uniref:CubicO group peptidase (Beta-lactamase class C family) n=1 Tax=Nonomuraea thailandensis TaxID=1188745 RepID=A0A9X2GN82_9ACTN|nr:serine hydrolase domain-containing protein [Nonomuraea thailandensis]MCP2357433.1 CubicO group peptidase (beta-lactamase class C family) [Nonomuraea thailandensis]